MCAPDVDSGREVGSGFLKRVVVGLRVDCTGRVLKEDVFTE